MSPPPHALRRKHEIRVGFCPFGLDFALPTLQEEDEEEKDENPVSLWPYSRFRTARLLEMVANLDSVTL